MQARQSLPTELQSIVQIRFQDCDPFGHLNNARYIDYFLNTRQDQLAEYYDFHIVEFGKQPQESWVISKTQITYLSPAHVAEPVSIRTRLLHMTRSKLLVEGLMLDRIEQQLKAVCWVEFTYVSLQTGRPTSHADDLAAFLGSVCLNFSLEMLDFDQRVQELRTHYHKVRRAARLSVVSPEQA